MRGRIALHLRESLRKQEHCVRKSKLPPQILYLQHRQRFFGFRRREFFVELGEIFFGQFDLD